MQQKSCTARPPARTAPHVRSAFRSSRMLGQMQAAGQHLQGCIPSGTDCLQKVVAMDHSEIQRCFYSYTLHPVNYTLPVRVHNSLETYQLNPVGLANTHTLQPAGNYKCIMQPRGGGRGGGSPPYKLCGGCPGPAILCDTPACSAARRCWAPQASPNCQATQHMTLHCQTQVAAGHLMPSSAVLIMTK